MDEKAMYQPVTREIVTELQAIVGEKNMIFDDPELLQNYSHDEVAGPEYARMPEVVVKPASAREISEIMKLANRHRVPVTPRGGGNGAFLRRRAALRGHRACPRAHEPDPGDRPGKHGGRRGARRRDQRDRQGGPGVRAFLRGLSDELRVLLHRGQPRGERRRRPRHQVRRHGALCPGPGGRPAHRRDRARWAASGSRTSRATISSTCWSARKGPWESSRRSSCGCFPDPPPRRSC